MDTFLPWLTHQPDQADPPATSGDLSNGDGPAP